MIVDAPEVIAIRHRRERAVEWKNLKTVPRQIEFANNFRAEQGDDIGANRKLEAGKNLLGDRRAAEHMTPLKHQHTLARARQISRIHQAVVAAADDDDVVVRFHVAQAVSWQRKLTVCVTKTA